MDQIHRAVTRVALLPGAHVDVGIGQGRQAIQARAVEIYGRKMDLAPLHDFERGSSTRFHYAIDLGGQLRKNGVFELSNQEWLKNVSSSAGRNQVLY